MLLITLGIVGCEHRSTNDSGCIATPSKLGTVLKVSLPAMRDDRKVVAALASSDLGARGEATLTMQIVDVARDRPVDEFPIFGPVDSKARTHPAGEAAARAYLARRRWSRLSQMRVEEDPDAPPHPTNPLALGAPSRANRASAGGIVILYREPLLTIQSESKVVVRRAVPGWSGERASHDCPPPWALIGDAWVDVEAGIAVVYVAYQGIESDICWTADPSIHVVAWKP